MNIAIFGASGRTGTLLTRLALDAGHNVSALVREPSKFPLRDQVRIVKGSVFDPVAVGDTLRNSEAVFSALGAHSPFRKEDVLERAVPLIVSRMQEHGPRRIIALGSAGALPDSLKFQPAWRRWIVEKIVYRLFLKYPVASQVDQYRVLSHGGLDWTMVMPPMLSNAPARHRYRIDPEGLPRNGSVIARADVAAFMLDQLSNAEWLRKGIYITW